MPACPFLIPFPFPLSLLILSQPSCHILSFIWHVSCTWSPVQRPPISSFSSSPSSLGTNKPESHKERNRVVFFFCFQSICYSFSLTHLSLSYSQSHAREPSSPTRPLHLPHLRAEGIGNGTGPLGFHNCNLLSPHSITIFNYPITTSVSYSSLWSLVWLLKAQFLGRVAWKTN